MGLSNAERQQRYCDRRKEQQPRVHYHRPPDRRSAGAMLSRPSWTCRPNTRTGWTTCRRSGPAPMAFGALGGVEIASGDAIEIAVHDFGDIHGHRVNLGLPLNSMCSPAGGDPRATCRPTWSQPTASRGSSAPSLSCDAFGDCGNGITNVYYHTSSDDTDVADLEVLYQFVP